MQMNDGLDTGDVLLTEKYPVPDAYDAGMLHDELAENAGPLVLKTLEGLMGGSIKPVKQSETGVTYAKKITKEESRIDWNQPALAIRNQIRGLSPTPGAYFMHGGESIKIFDALAMSTEPGDLTRGVKSGEVVSHHLDIACEGGKSILSPLEMQRPGKKRMHKQDLLQGFAIVPGTVLT
jgi:methionyl-tRNA formyltransferase